MPDFEFRQITAEQYMKNEDPQGGFDEAWIEHPETGTRHEIWDVGVCKTTVGTIAIYTAAAEPIYVEPSHTIEVR